MSAGETMPGDALCLCLGQPGHFYRTCPTRAIVAARLELQEAAELLRRWHELAVGRWYDHSTTGIDTDTRAWLARHPDKA